MCFEVLLRSCLRTTKQTRERGIALACVLLAWKKDVHSNVHSHVGLRADQATEEVRREENYRSLQGNVGQSCLNSNRVVLLDDRTVNIHLSIRNQCIFRKRTIIPKERYFSPRIRPNVFERNDND